MGPRDLTWAARASASKGGVLALLSKKLLVNSIGVLFGLLGKTGNREAIQAAAGYLSTAVYTMYRRLYDANPDSNPDFFSVNFYWWGYFLSRIAFRPMLMAVTRSPVL